MDSIRDTRSLALTLRNSLSEFQRITPQVISFLEDSGVTHTAAYAARVAVEELVVNVIRYAFDDQREHEISLEIAVDDKGIVVAVEDDGRPFDPRAVAAPDLAGSVEERRAGGWGIHLVRSMSEDISYRRLAHRNRVRVRIPIG